MPSASSIPYANLPPAPLWRRLAALFYDGLLCVAICFVTSLIYFLVLNLVYGTEQMKALSESGALDSDPILGSFLFLATFMFFAYFWRKLGQTLGMQAWRVRVQNPDGSTLRWTQCLLRFFGALFSLAVFGMGFWWSLWDKEKKTWHDRYSLSSVVLMPAPQKSRGR